MYLTREEESMLAGEHGYAAQKAMEILVALGKIYKAERMIRIRSAQISGVSYKNLGEEGLEFISKLAEDGEVRVPTTLNPCGMDLERWREIGIPENFAEKQFKVIGAYMRLGVKPTLTCTPYLAGNTPEYGDHVAWSESSAIIYANSVIGARTNREGGPSALAAAIAGRTPLYGFHLDENRTPSVEVHAPELSEEYEFAALGYLVGRIVGDGIPLFKGLGVPSRDQLKALGAGLACAGGVALFHVDGVTPECVRNPPRGAGEKIEVELREIREVVRELNTGGSEPDLIFIGCPHASIEQLMTFLELLRGRRVRRETWILTSRAVRDQAEKLGIAEKLESLGVKVLCDTCPIVAPMKSLGVRTIATDSAKGAWFSRNLNGLEVKFEPVEGLVENAL
ncbi:MAG: aconitase X catalytic domain-containing protein [Nitrososphaerota archaeon]|nr:aconitase X catalytic domain-containing protein [Nitrososphaerota archaeon]